MANGNAIIIVSSARQEHSAVFSACQVLFHTIYNEPVAGDRAHYALASAFWALLKMLGWRILQGFQSLFHFLKKRCFHRLLREYPTDSLL